MKKWVCTVCGYVYEGDAAPEFCPVCKAPASKFKEQAGEMTWAAEHVVGVAQGVSEDILADLRANFEGECSEVGMYLAMARVAHREGYPEIGLYWEKAAYEEAEHAAKFAELLGEVVTDSTKKNLEMRVAAEHGATEGKFDLAKRAKAANLDAIHDTVHEMARDEARHGKAFAGLLKEILWLIDKNSTSVDCKTNYRYKTPESGNTGSGVLYTSIFVSFCFILLFLSLAILKIQAKNPVYICETQEQSVH